MDATLHQIALTLLPQVGPLTTKLLVSYCGSAEAVFRNSKRSLLKIPGIGQQTVESLLKPADALAAAEHELSFLEKHNVTALFYTDNRYPARLRQCLDAPALLYFKGSDTALLDADRILAIVGTRQPSEHGKSICEDIITAMEPYNVMIVSGLAFGVDITAHRRATSLNIPNIGVLGHGLGSIYPHSHKSTALQMVEHGGLLSEYIHNAKPDREHFPMRNRIISGMSDAVLVVESGESGGSIITVQCAERYGREIFAVPGRPGDPKSAGCNALIKNERAKLVETAQDIATCLNWDEPQHTRPRQMQLFLELLPGQQRILDAVRQQPEIPIDQLAQQAALPAGELAQHILELEFKGILRTLPGKRYIAC